jgi:hypothetical protein
MKKLKGLTGNKHIDDVTDEEFIQMIDLEKEIPEQPDYNQMNKHLDGGVLDFTKLKSNKIQEKPNIRS